MKYSYKTKGVCSQQINFDINGNVVTNISFIGGCNGNLKAVSKLCEGKTAEEISSILLGNECAMRGTSCTDQLAKAVMEAAKEV